MMNTEEGHYMVTYCGKPSPVSAQRRSLQTESLIICLKECQLADGKACRKKAYRPPKDFKVTFFASWESSASLGSTAAAVLLEDIGPDPSEEDRSAADGRPTFSARIAIGS